MVKLKKKMSKKQSQRIKTLVLGTGLLICCCIVFILLLSMNMLGSTIYKVESRVDNIKKEKRLDKTDKGYKTIAWLRVQGTNIDTPIVGYDQSMGLAEIDKENYLWNNVNKEELFNQVTISGHNILNLSANPKIGLEYFSRFDDLMAFVYPEFIEENKFIQYTIDGKDYIYKIFGVFFEKDYNLNLWHEGNYTKEEKKEYIKNIEKLNIYNFDIDINENDSLITLTTCTRLYGGFNKKQFVVVGRLLREDEKMTNYDVTLSEKYAEVKEKMKGDDTDAQV